MRKEKCHRPGAEVVVFIYTRDCAADTPIIHSTAKSFAPGASEESLARVHCMKRYDTCTVIGTNPDIQSEYKFYLDGKDDAVISSAKLSAALAIKPKRSLTASHSPRNGARLPGAAAAGAGKPISYQESQQRAFAALMGQAPPANSNKADQPAAATHKRARQRKTEEHTKSPTGAAPASTPSALLERRSAAKPSTQTAGQGKSKPSAPAESQQHAFAALMGQAAPTHGNTMDQPAAATPQRARQRKTEHVKSATGAAPASMPSALLEGPNAAKPSAQTTGQGKSKPSASALSAPGSILSSSTVAPSVKKPGAAGTSGAPSAAAAAAAGLSVGKQHGPLAPAGLSAGKLRGSEAPLDFSFGKLPGSEAPLDFSFGKLPGSEAPLDFSFGKLRGSEAPLDFSFGKLPGSEAPLDFSFGKLRGSEAPLDFRFGKLPGKTTPAAHSTDIPPGSATAAAAGLGSGKLPGSAAATGSGHCSAGLTNVAGRQAAAAAERSTSGHRGGTRQAPGGLQDKGSSVPVFDDGGPEYTAASAIRAGYAALKALKEAEAQAAAEALAAAETEAAATAQAAAHAQAAAEADAADKAVAAAEAAAAAKALAAAHAQATAEAEAAAQAHAAAAAEAAGLGEQQRQRG